MGTKVTVKFDRICDRQDLIKVMEARKLGLEPYMMDRDDMYWAKVHIVDEGLDANISYCIDYSERSEDGWSFTKQYGPDVLDSVTVREKVRRKWMVSEESISASKWVDNLIEAGYYDHGRCGGKNTNAGRCPHCGFLFEKGTSHPHTYLIDWNHKGEKEIIYHHRLMEKTIKELGLTKLGVSALPDIPSLEEIGELQTVMVS